MIDVKVCKCCEAEVDSQTFDYCSRCANPWSGYQCDHPKCEICGRAMSPDMRYFCSGQCADAWYEGWN